MNNLKLERQRYTDKSVIGSIYLDNEFICWSLEDFDKYIPQGTYHLVEHMYKGKTPTYALVNAELEVTYYPDRYMPSNRFMILIHPGNTADDTEGCILVGTETEQDVVLNSREAFAHLIELIQQHEIRTITIV